MTQFTGYRLPDITLTRSRVTAPNKIEWVNRTKDRTTSNLLVNMPVDLTVFGRASKQKRASVIDNHVNRATRTDAGMGAWRKAMGLD